MVADGSYQKLIGAPEPLGAIRSFLIVVSSIIVCLTKLYLVVRCKDARGDRKSLYYSHKRKYVYICICMYVYIYLYYTHMYNVYIYTFTYVYIYISKL